MCRAQEGATAGADFLGADSRGERVRPRLRSRHGRNTLLQAAKGRQNKAHGVSRGLQVRDEQAPKGRKTSSHIHESWILLSPLRVWLLCFFQPTGCAVSFILAPLRGWNSLSASIKTPYSWRRMGRQRHGRRAKSRPDISSRAGCNSASRQGSSVITKGSADLSKPGFCKSESMFR